MWRDDGGDERDKGSTGGQIEKTEAVQKRDEVAERRTVCVCV